MPGCTLGFAVLSSNCCTPQQSVHVHAPSQQALEPDATTSTIFLRRKHSTSCFATMRLKSLNCICPRLGVWSTVKASRSEAHDAGRNPSTDRHRPDCTAFSVLGLRIDCVRDMPYAHRQLQAQLAVWTCNLAVPSQWQRWHGFGCTLLTWSSSHPFFSMKFMNCSTSFHSCTVESISGY